MSARVLVVDDFAPNRTLLEAHLTAEYFDVTCVSNGADALAVCARGGCDIVLLDVMMPGMDGFEVCRRLKGEAATHHIPVVLVTALDQPSDRVRGLEAGAEDFLTKPIDEIALIARVRALSRLNVVLDELRSRAATSTTLGMPDPMLDAMRTDLDAARVLVIDDRVTASRQIAAILTTRHLVDVETDPREALFKAADGDYDLFVVSLGLQGSDALRLCSQLRSLERTRQVPIVLIADPEDRTRLLRGLDLGVNDYLLRPIDRNELIARARTQLRRKFYTDRLRNNVQASIEMAIVDTLTSLHNRRYFNTNFSALMEQAVRRGRSLSLMILDIDHFKQVNDTYGHDAGDSILRGFASRIRNAIRSSDLICRLGGEEFAVLMPETSLEAATNVAERVRRSIDSAPFALALGETAIAVTVSIGLAERGVDVNPERLMRRADAALYRSKGEGRNRVTADAA